MVDRNEGLDFSDNARPGNICGAVSAILSHFGDQGATTADLCGVVQKNLPQYNPNSVSPAVSNLIWLGCAREERRFGVRRIYHVRAYDYDNDTTRLSKRKRDQILASQERQRATEAPPMQKVTLHAGILVAFGTNRTEVLSITDARAIYEQLKSLFGPA